MDKLKTTFTKMVSTTLLGMVLFNSSPAEANFSFKIGMSKADVSRILISKGYTQIQVHDTGFKTGKAFACKDGIKYNVKVDYKGRVKGQSKVGSCRNTVSPKQIKQNLRANGFERIVIDEQNQKYVVLGCKGNQRVRLILSLQGQALQRRNIGRCQNELAPSDVRQALRDNGYNRIEFTDRQLPRYVANACLRGTKLELVINRFGEIRNERRIGRCNPKINSNNLQNIMQQKGYDRIEIINARAPRYQVEACNENTHFKVTLDVYGKITQRENIGSCRNDITQREIVQLLRNEGFSRINVKRQNNGAFNINACLQGYQKLIKLSRYGDLLEERDGNACKSQSLDTVRKNYTNRGFRKVSFYMEACKNGNKFRIELDKFGDPIGRERIGRC